MTSSPYDPYELGYTRATMIFTKSHTIEKSWVNLQNLSCSDCGLKFARMKVESQVIVDQHATVNFYLDLVHTARHMLGVSLVWNFKIFSCFLKISVCAFFYKKSILKRLRDLQPGWSRNKVVVRERVAGTKFIKKINIYIYKFV